MNTSDLKQEFTKAFDTKPGRVFFSPGRINLIGEHTDYNGGHVFPCAITIGTYGVYAPRTDTDFLDAFYKRLATSLALKPALPVIKANAKVSIQVRENATTRYYFVINFSHRPTTVTLEVPLRQIFENQVVSGKQDLASYGVQVYMMNK